MKNKPQHILEIYDNRCYSKFGEKLSPKQRAYMLSAMLEMLEDYSKFLEMLGYMDTDWRAEQPTAIDSYIKGDN